MADFINNAGGAAFGNPNLTRQGRRAGAIQQPDSPPAKADAAPKGNTINVFTGLAEALNEFQNKLVADGTYEYGDQYVFEFAPPELAASTLKRDGSLVQKNTPMNRSTTANDKINPNTNSVNNNGRRISVSAGMQIVQFIDQIMRSSSYITDQQTYIIDENTGQPKPNASPQQTAWYKISFEATQLEYDKKRRDHAYRMKFLISPYAINSAQSEYFADSRYRGSHKSYYYWFTGQNTQVLNFEQDFNNLYRLTISGLNIPTIEGSTSDARDLSRKTFSTASEQSSQFADGKAAEPAANLAEFLYSPTDQSKIKLRIVGDPAWMQQGEISQGVSASTFNFNPFNADGTINYDSQEIIFDVSWNQPGDYNLNTGLYDLDWRTKPTNNKPGEPLQNSTYVATSCKNIFSKGKFEQELEGRLLVEFKKPETTRNVANPDTAGRAPTIQENGPALLSSYSKKVGWPQSTVQSKPASSIISPEIISNNLGLKQPLPSSTPSPATSDASIINVPVITNPQQAGYYSPENQQRLSPNVNNSQFIPPPVLSRTEQPKTFAEAIEIGKRQAGIIKPPQLINKDTN